MQLVGAGMHDDAKWDLSVILGESSRLRRRCGWMEVGRHDGCLLPAVAGT
jgi:hypothetical protein